LKVMVYKSKRFVRRKTQNENETTGVVKHKGKSRKRSFTIDLDFTRLDVTR